MLWNYPNKKAGSLDLREPKQPRKRKVPQKLLENYTASTTYDEVSDAKTYHRRIYVNAFNALDAVINAVKDRFDQPGYTNYENIEQLLLSAVHGKCTKPWVDEIKKTYEGDINIYLLDSQLESLSVELKNKHSTCLRDITNHIKEPGSKTIIFSEVIILLKILMAAPATNAAIERAASQLRRVKTWLRTKMTQKRLNYLMLLPTHKEKTDELDLIKVAHDFCEGNRDRFSNLSVFTEEAFPKLSSIL